MDIYICTNQAQLALAITCQYRRLRGAHRIIGIRMSVRHSISASILADHCGRATCESGGRVGLSLVGLVCLTRSINNCVTEAHERKTLRNVALG
jgi:hypothetical protein